MRTISFCIFIAISSLTWADENRGKAQLNPAQQAFSDALWRMGYKQPEINDVFLPYFEKYGPKLPGLEAGKSGTPFNHLRTAVSFLQQEFMDPSKAANKAAYKEQIEFLERLEICYHSLQSRLRTDSEMLLARAKVPEKKREQLEQLKNKVSEPVYVISADANRNDQDIFLAEDPTLVEFRLNIAKYVKATDVRLLLDRARKNIPTSTHVTPARGATPRRQP